MSRIGDVRETIRRVQAGNKGVASTIESRNQTLIPNYNPTQKQQEAKSAIERFILYGGAMGGGKSVWLCCEAIEHCLKYPKARVYLCRQHLASFKKTTLLTLLEWLPLSEVAKHNKSDNFIKFKKNGSMIFYGGLGDDIKSIEKLKSMELSAFGIDQVEEVSEGFFHMLASRLRLNIPNVRYRGWLTANPSSNWVRERFLENQFHDHKFVQSLPSDNPHLVSDYEEQLRKTLPEELVRIWIEGDWDSISDEQSVFPFDLIASSQKRKVKGEGLEIFSCDPARYGQDSSVIAKRQGLSFEIVKVFAKADLMRTAGELIRAVNNNQETEIRIDSIGVGAGLFDRLKEQKYKVAEIIGSERSSEPRKYRNKRAENYFSFRKALEDGASIPDDSKLRAEMLSIRYRILSDGLIQIESKDELRKRGLNSPDRLDALVMLASQPRWASMDELDARMPIKAGDVGTYKPLTVEEREQRDRVLAELKQEGII